MTFFLNRMREPSTWCGLAILATQAVAAFAQRDPAAIGTAVAGLVAILMPERSVKP
jgi:hypothetical protein